MKQPAQGVLGGIRIPPRLHEHIENATAVVAVSRA
jgi:hypothetical protein